MLSGNFFADDSLNNFISFCKAIESDPNYQPDISNKALLSLVVDESGRARHTPRKSALAIQPSEILPMSETGDSIGAIYQIKIGMKGPIDDDSDLPFWHIDDSAVILVRKNGEGSLHRKEDVVQGNFNAPITHFKVDDFLRQACLHYPEEVVPTLTS